MSTLPKIYCKHCQDDMPLRAISSNGVFYYNDREDLRWYKRTRRCDACGNSIITGEISEELIDKVFLSILLEEHRENLLTEYRSKNVDLEIKATSKDREIEDLKSKIIERDNEIARLRVIADRYDNLLLNIPSNIIDSYCNKRLISLWKQTPWLRDGSAIHIDVCKDFIRHTAWWLTHASGPVRAPGHSKHVYSTMHGWAIDFGGNTFLIETALRCARHAML